MEWSRINRNIEAEVVPVCARYGLGVVSYFPLASGLLSGKYQRGADAPEGSRFAAMPFFAGVATDDNWDKVEKLTQYADGLGWSLLDLALSWVAAQPHSASVLVGATRPEQVAANAAAIDRTLTADQLAEIDQLIRQRG